MQNAVDPQGTSEPACPTSHERSQSGKPRRRLRKYPAQPPLPEPYASRLEGLLEFRDLASAESSLRRLDAAYREYQQGRDRQGMRLVRDLALKGKQRAAGLARNPRVNATKREEKQEIADWFRVWLESADLFFDWLELRKRAGDFVSRFGQAGGN